MNKYYFDNDAESEEIKMIPVAKGEFTTVPKERAEKFLSFFEKPSPHLEKILNHKPIHKNVGAKEKE